MRQVIPLEIESDNKFKNQMGRGSFWRYQKYKNMWFDTIALFFRQKTADKKKMYVEITRVYAKPKRAFDKGNFISGCKPVLDSLKKQGYIWDDSPKWIDDQYLQMPGLNNETIIVISDTL